MSQSLHNILSCNPLVAGLLLLWSAGPAMAAPSQGNNPLGSCWADPMNIVTANLGMANFNSTRKGGTASVLFKTSSMYIPIWCYSDNTTGNKQSASYFTATVGQNQSGNHNYISLGPDVEFIIGLDLDQTGEYWQAPFDDLFVKTATAGPYYPGVTSIPGAESANNGVIHLRLKHDIIGGAVTIPGYILLTTVYRYTFSHQPATQPFIKIYSRVQTLPVPVMCKINAGNLIKVPFETIDNTKITASAFDSPYKVTKSLTYNCNLPLTQDIKVTLKTTQATNFGDAIATSNKDIGVAMFYSGRLIKPDNSFISSIYNGNGNDSVTFVAFKRPNSTPEAGEFTGSATLVLDSL